MNNLEYGKWYPIEEYFKHIDVMDWALVQFKERYTDFYPLPVVVEFNKRDKVWVNYSNKDRYIVEMLEPVAFMLWQPYEELKEYENCRN